MRFSRRGLIALGITMALLACAKQVKRQLTAPDAAASLDKHAPFLKVHLRDGQLYILSEWRVDSLARRVSGRGQHVGPDRAVPDTGSFAVSLDSVALFETNVVSTSPNVTALAALTVITGAVTVACIANPKACFGSCPTFYAATPTGEHLLAEGFSASIAPALEATDLDALYPAQPAGRTLELHMRNEAWETHVVRWVRVLAAPRASGGRVFATADGQLLQADHLAAPDRCAALEGDCRELLAAQDRRERTSPVDSTDLAQREVIDLEFDHPPDGDLGVVIAYRQTLLTTYVFYQALAWMGDRAGEWLASMDRTPAMRGTAGAVGSVLGRIEVLVADAQGGWTPAAAVGETGPLATDVKVAPVPRPAAAGPLRVRLRLTRGLWRLDQIALARLGARVTPQRLRPATIAAAGQDSAELRAWVADSTRPLVTRPGDDVRLTFALPDESDRVELFLEARGYYLEWMRREWLAEAQPALAARLYLDPAGSLRALAPTFSKLAPGLERTFWSSRYARN